MAINVTAMQEGAKTTTSTNMADADVVKTLQEYDLLLDEIENILQEELIAIHLLRKKNNYEPKTIFEFAIRLLERKKHRSIKEEAVLAYAQTQLRKVTKETTSSGYQQLSDKCSST